MRILFWNTHRNVDINSYILDIVNQNEIDVLVLAEYMAEINELNDNLKQCKKRLFNWNTKGCERIHIWGNYIDVTPGEQNKYFSVQIVNKQYIMCGVHMYSNLNGEHYDERVALAEEIMYSIKHIKQRLQTEHVIVIGDINESPYEKACLSAKGFHALPALQILDKGSRTVYGKEYEKMYNPMWNLFGDFKYPPGTYYRVESKLYNPCWFMLDQVIISQSMIMFLRYGAIAYPVEVVLNEDIAEAYNGKKQYIYDVDSMEELKTMFETIINTDFCTNLIQSLIYESMRQSRKDKSEN